VDNMGPLGKTIAAAAGTTALGTGAVIHHSSDPTRRAKTRKVLSPILGKNAFKRGLYSEKRDLKKTASILKEAWFWESDEIKQIRKEYKNKKKKIDSDFYVKEIENKALPGYGAYRTAQIGGAVAGAYLGSGKDSSNSIPMAYLGSQAGGALVNNEYSRAKQLNEVRYSLNSAKNRSEMKAAIKAAKMEKKAELEKDAFIGTAVKAGIGLARKGLQSSAGQRFAKSAFGRNSINAVKNFAASNKGQAMRQGLMRADSAIRGGVNRVMSGKIGQNAVRGLDRIGFNNSANTLNKFRMNGIKNARRFGNSTNSVGLR
jgi:predicted Fe-Mo cluster-binding NifX family protein